MSESHGSFMFRLLLVHYVVFNKVNLGAFAAGVSVAWSSSALPLLIAGQPEVTKEFRKYKLRHGCTEKPEKETSTGNRTQALSNPCCVL
ncbi:hypothetical protein MSG28_014376 [Choristoneura fumiferana]|uniref:Uncharacterized protein n=1 Tax=Choristoneura fumiferana TaxID=7141 RepID=A0ACC0JGV7_CHOFU|nr:hypothetical protein MSG28_014376 [Choristoneura fumiferana]